LVGHIALLAAAFQLPSVIPRPGIVDDQRRAVSGDDGRKVRNYAAVDTRRSHDDGTCAETMSEMFASIKVDGSTSADL
jgi:hypothetical protein